jgi:hypothetical protein
MHLLHSPSDEIVTSIYIFFSVLFLASCLPLLFEEWLSLFVLDQAGEESIHECTVLSLNFFFTIFLPPILF